MSMDVLQEKIRKLKNPSVLDLTLPKEELPAHLLQEEQNIVDAYRRFCMELLERMRGVVPAVRLSFTAFSLLGTNGLEALSEVLQAASAKGFYTILEAPYLLSPMMASAAAQTIFGADSPYPCDGLIVSAYIGSDVIKPFLPLCREEKKDLFLVVRTSNKTAPEIQDLLTGTRLVHMAAADVINRFGADNVGRFGFARVSVLAGASSAESLKALRSKYPRLFLLLDDMDYSGCNAKICGYGFDQFGRGAAVCAGPSITCAWKEMDRDGKDYLDCAVAAAERMRKNLTRYTTIM